MKSRRGQKKGRIRYETKILKDVRRGEKAQRKRLRKEGKVEKL